MKCSSFHKKMINLEYQAAPEVVMVWHALFCKTCRSDYRGYKEGLISLSQSASFRSSLTTGSIMDQIYAMTSPQEKGESHYLWIIASIPLFSSALFLTQSNYYHDFRAICGETFPIVLFLVIGVCITIFSLMYVFSHIDQLKKMFHL